MQIIESQELTKSYGSIKALENLSFEIAENKITGLIGRNGSGKTTLLKLIVGFLKPTAGGLKVLGENPFNSLKVSSNTIFVDESMNLTLPGLLTLQDILTSAARFYPTWDQRLASGLFNYFNINPKQRLQALSKGTRSTFNMIIGLSTRCALTLLDEPTSGMDAAVRKDFYKAMLRDYLDHPRTIIVSSHLLNEIEDILEDILLIKDGEKCLHMPVCELDNFAIGLRGKADVITDLTRGRQSYHCKSFGKDGLYCAVKNEFSEDSLQLVRQAGVDITPVKVDDLCVYLTAKNRGGIDDVFKRN